MEHGAGLEKFVEMEVLSWVSRFIIPARAPGAGMTP